MRGRLLIIYVAIIALVLGGLLGRLFERRSSRALEESANELRTDLEDARRSLRRLLTDAPPGLASRPANDSTGVDRALLASIKELPANPTRTEASAYVG